MPSISSDQDYESKTAAAFNEAFQVHTSTSPNYQIIASLDLARRQVDLEGYGMLTDVYQMAQTFRLRVAHEPKLREYFRVLDQRDLVPKEYRPSGFEAYTDLASRAEQEALNRAFTMDELMLDRTRCTLYWRPQRATCARPT